MPVLFSQEGKTERLEVTEGGGRAGWHIAALTLQWFSGRVLLALSIASRSIAEDIVSG